MYINENSAQMALEGFYAPFAERLSSENRWVKLSRKMPWDKIEEEYLKNIDLKNGRPANILADRIRRVLHSICREHHG